MTGRPRRQAGNFIIADKHQMASIRYPGHLLVFAIAARHRNRRANGGHEITESS